MQYLLYVRLCVLVAEFVWLVVGVVWLSRHYRTCTSQTAKDAILGIVVCNWCVMVSVVLTVWCTFDAAGRSWVKMKRYQRSMRDSHSKFQYRRSGNRQRNWRQRKVLRAYQDSWYHRCRFLFCCMTKNDNNRNSFSDIARLLSEFFRDLDVVPSDVVAGLVLLRKYQKLDRKAVVESKKNDVYEFLSGVPITPRTQFVQLSTVDGQEQMELLVHYMRFALAVYGWPMHLMANSAVKACTLCPLLSCWQCCCKRGGGTAPPEVVKDNCCGCNTAALLRMAPSEGVELVYVTYHVDIGETPFFVALDHARRAVVLSIRGTLSMKDVVTDLNAESEPLPMDAVKEDWLGHKGMVNAAEYIRRKLREGDLLNRAFGHDPNRGTHTYDLVLVGHSLGAGTASILAILLKQEYPNLVCFSYSPPGGLLSLPAVEYTRSFITSVVVGKDVVPRIGLHQMETLRADLINAIKRSRDPKWKTITLSLRCCGGWKDPGGEAEEWSTSRCAMRSQSAHPSDSSIALTVHPPLYPPGKILHVVRSHPEKKQSWCSSQSPVYQAVWVDNKDFDEVLISPCMIQDHMPDTVLTALTKVLECPGPMKPQRTPTTTTLTTTSPATPIPPPTPEEMAHHSATHLDPERCRLISRPHTPTFIMKPSPTASSLLSTTRPTPPPHKILLETSFTSSPAVSPEPPPDLRNHAHAHSPALTWDLLSALEEQILLGVRENSRRPLLSESSTIGRIDLMHDDWLGLAPLASPETLSEVSSVASRASLLLRDPHARSSFNHHELARRLSSNTSLGNQHHPHARLGQGYCFFVETPPLDSRRRVFPVPQEEEVSTSDGSDVDEITTRSITPTDVIVLDPILPSPPPPPPAPPPSAHDTATPPDSAKSPGSPPRLSSPLGLSASIMGSVERLWSAAAAAASSQPTPTLESPSSSSSSSSSSNSSSSSSAPNSSHSINNNENSSSNSSSSSVSPSSSNSKSPSSSSSSTTSSSSSNSSSSSSSTSSSSTRGSRGSHRVKFDLTASQVSRDSGYGERVNGFEAPVHAVGSAPPAYPAWGVQQEYGRGAPPITPHYVYSGHSPTHFSPGSPTTDSDVFTSPLSSDPPSSRLCSLLPTPVDVPFLPHVQPHVGGAGALTLHHHTNPLTRELDSGYKMVGPTQPVSEETVEPATPTSSTWSQSDNEAYTLVTESSL
ncbi:uncharacterized protein LOC143027590 [Oratosquilla oratoria]|uniref:uncharacterized protein LOC143027590 n=1 Tax=Oratosquilla oratoria TaxID=337810 RepID=UPI003F75F50A